MTSYLYRFLDTDGDGTGTKTAVGDYSDDPGSGVEIFYIAPPANTVYEIARIIPHVVDAGTFDSGSYGNGIDLTNGIVIRISDSSGVLVDLTDDLPVITNTDWGRLCYDVTRSTFGTGNEYLHARWTFAKSGQPVRLVGDSGHKLEVVLNDDFSDLVEQYFMVQGIVKGIGLV